MSMDISTNILGLVGLRRDNQDERAASIKVRAAGSS